MTTQKAVIQNESGLHARPSAELVRLASTFKSDFYIGLQGYRVNGKSILGVMTLAAECGAELELMTDGPDEKEAMKAIASLFDNRFNLDRDE
ncbi:MAG: HPr family phosphocarrier protein [Balneolaceae bacterium]